MPGGDRSRRRAPAARPGAVVALALVLGASACASGPGAATAGAGVETPGTNGGSGSSAGTGTAPPPAWTTTTVAANGEQLSVSCAGQGDETVVFVSNLAEDDTAGWRASGVPDQVARDTRACVYDRPGLGASAASSKPRTVANQVADLAALVEAGALTRPLVVVGHRYGTHIVRQYAQDHRRDVVGMVLVDPPLEKLDPTAPGALTAGQQAEYDTVPALNEDLGAYGAGKLPPPPAPTIVLGTGDEPPLPPTVPAGGPTVATAAALAPAEPGDVRRGGQAQLARKSPFGSFRDAPGSGSYLQFWQPDAVVDAVATVLADPRRPT